MQIKAKSACDSTCKFRRKITYQTSLDEIYDVHILDNKMRPNILNTITEDHTQGLMTEKATFWGKKTENKLT